MVLGRVESGFLLRAPATDQNVGAGLLTQSFTRLAPIFKAVSVSSASLWPLMLLVKTTSLPRRSYTHSLSMQ